MNELQTIETNGSVMDLTCARPPAMVIEEARKAAVALKDVLDKKPNKVMMNKEQYLEFEDWQTVAQFYGCKVKITETKPVQFGSVMGFEAKAVCFHVATGREVSSAESMCLNDEEKWSVRNKYELAYCKKSGGHSVEDPGKDEIVWEENPYNPGRKRPKKERVIVGQESVPLFQLRSMAQTRAGGKAFRNAFAWVVVLAGYKPTPAEELPDASIVANQWTEQMSEQEKQPVQQAKQTATDKASSVLSKMKPVVHGKGDGTDAPAQTGSRPQQGSDAPSPQQFAERLEMAESVAELSGVMNDAVAVEMSAEDRATLKTVFETHLARLKPGKK